MVETSAIEKSVVAPGADRIASTAPFAHQKADSPEKISSLTALRFFAALCVVLHHMKGHFGLGSHFLEPFALEQGVSFFFVLSGFILSFVYGTRLHTIGSSQSEEKAWGKLVSTFLVARLARIWPLHIACLLLSLLLLPSKFQADFTVFNLLASLLLVQAWIPILDTTFAFNGVSWSLSAEFFFYLVFPLLIWQSNLPARRLANLTITLLSVTFFVALSGLFNLPEMACGTVSYHELLYAGPLCRVFEFTLGISAYYLFLALKQNSAYKPAKSLETSWRAPLLFTALELAAVAVSITSAFYSERIAHFLSRLLTFQTAAQAPLFTWLHHAGTVAPAFALTIVVFALNRGWFSRALGSPLLVYLGEISFSVYLVHRLLLYYYYNHFATFEGWLPITLYAGSVLAASHLLYVFVECPFRQAIVSCWKTKKPVWQLPQLAWFNRAFLAIDCLFIAALLLFIQFGQSAVAQVSQVQDKHSAVAARFGKDVELVASRVERRPEGAICYLTWRTLKEQRLEGFVSLQLRTAKDEYYKRRDYKRAWREDHLAEGALYQDKIILSNQELENTAFLKIGIWGIGNDLATLPAYAGNERLSDDKVTLPLAAK